MSTDEQQITASLATAEGQSHMKRYPRVLVVTPEALHTPSATGLTLASLFADWPPDRLANLYYNGAPPPSDLCGHAWQVRVHTFPHRAANRIAYTLLGRVGTGVVPGLESTKPMDVLVSRLGLDFIALADMLGSKLDPNTLSEIARFQPDIVYSILWGFTGMRVTIQAASIAKCPIVPHFMDDWPATQYQEAFLSIIWRRFVVCRLYRIMADVSIGLAICEDMAEEYARLYKIPFASFMRCLDLSEFAHRPKTGPHACLRLVYAGGLYLGRAKTLAAVAAALDQLCSEGFDAVLIIHSPRNEDEGVFHSALASFRSAFWGGSLQPSEVASVLQNSDVAVHVESFDPRAESYTRLSVSTKFPSYMAAGLPILAVGPATIASTRYVQRHGIGIAVTEPDLALIASAIREVSQPERWSFFSARAYEVCQAQHAATTVRDQFATLLINAARPSTL